MSDTPNAATLKLRNDRGIRDSKRPLFTVPVGLVRILDRELLTAGIDKRDERGRTIDVHALRHSFGTLLSKGGVAPRTVQAAMRHSSIDLTTKVYTDPKLLDVVGTLDSLPSLDLNAAPPTERNSMRATGTDDKPCFSGATGKSFVAPPVAPNVGERGQTVSFAVISSDIDDERMATTATNKNHYDSSKKASPAVFAGEASDVGATGFEPATSWSQTRRSSQAELRPERAAV